MNVTDLVLDNLDASAAIADYLDDDDRPDVAAAAADLGRATRRLLDALLADLMRVPGPIPHQASQGN